MKQKVGAEGWENGRDAMWYGHRPLRTEEATMLRACLCLLLPWVDKRKCPKQVCYQCTWQIGTAQKERERKASRRAPRNATTPPAGLTWLWRAVQILLQERHGADGRGRSRRVHKLCGREVSRGAAEDEQSGREVKTSRIFQRKENKAKDTICTNFRMD